MQYIHINTDTGELRVYPEPKFDSVWTIYQVDDSYQLNIPLQVMHNVMYVFEHVITDLTNVELIYRSALTGHFELPGSELHDAWG